MQAFEGLRVIDFTHILDDPAEAEAVTRDNLKQYSRRWQRRTRLLGANNQWVRSHQSRQDADGILTDWKWWVLKDTVSREGGLPWYRPATAG